MKFLAAWNVTWTSSLVVGVLALGCSSSQPELKGDEPNRASASAIQGGAVDGQQHPFAVGVCGGTKGNCNLFCSGALIAPNLVVTARHCVDGINQASPQDESVTCTTSVFTGRLQETFSITTSGSMYQSTTGWHSVAKIVTPPATKVCGNDIALLVLSTNVTAAEATPITPIVQYPMTDHTRYTTQQTAIGYGISSPNSNTQGTRRIRQAIPVVCIPGDGPGLDCGNAAALAQRNMTENEYEAGNGTCSGDSGSSAFEQSSFEKGTPASFGVLSRGGVSADNTTCVGAVYTRLDKWRDLIVTTVTQAAATGGYPLPPWTVFVPPTPTPDGGPKPTPTPTDDAGVSTLPTQGALGQACSQDTDCASSLCRGTSGSQSFTCTQGCDTTMVCPSGFACQAGFCFAGADEAPPPPTATTPQAGTTTTSGCSISSPGRQDPTKPVPWRWVALGLVAGLAALRRWRVRSPAILR